MRSGNEHLRLIAKQAAGCSFFVTQVVYDVNAAKDLISDYRYECAGQNLEPVPIVFTFSVCGSMKTLEFLRWLGIDVPRWIANELRHADDTLDASYEQAVATAIELHRLLPAGRRSLRPERRERLDTQSRDRGLRAARRPAKGRTPGVERPEFAGTRSRDQRRPRDRPGGGPVTISALLQLTTASAFGTKAAAEGQRKGRCSRKHKRRSYRPPGSLGVGPARAVAGDPAVVPSRRGAVRDPGTDRGTPLGGVGGAQAVAPCRRRCGRETTVHAAPTAACSRGRDGARRRSACGDSTAARARQPRDHQRLSAGHR